MSEFIYKNKVKLIVIFCFISGALLGSNVDFNKLIYGYDRTTYIESCDLIEKNEKEADEIIELLNNSDTDYALSELDNAKDLIIENLRIYNNLLLMENLDRKLMLSCLKLKKYSSRKLRYYSLLAKRIESDDPFSYSKELEDTKTEIYRILDGGGTLPLR